MDLVPAPALIYERGGLHFSPVSDTLTKDFSAYYLPMPITTSAKKALRQSKRRRVANVRSLDKMRLVAKEIRSLAQKKKLDEAKKLIPRLYQAIDKAVKNNVIKKNAASRKKSRLTASLYKTSAQK